MLKFSCWCTYDGDAPLPATEEGTPPLNVDLSDDVFSNPGVKPGDATSGRAVLPADGETPLPECSPSAIAWFVTEEDKPDPVATEAVSPYTGDGAAAGGALNGAAASSAGRFTPGTIASPVTDFAKAAAWCSYESAKSPLALHWEAL